jgi:methionyl-tRNA formyltransferase
MEYLNNWIENNLGKILIRYLEGNIKPIVQNKNLATWVGKRDKNDCKIDFSRDHKYLRNFFRALVTPYPLPYIEIARNNTMYSVKKASFIERNIDTNIGRILNIDHEGIYISSKDGYVILNQLLDSNNRVVDFNRFKIGTYLNQEPK